MDHLADTSDASESTGFYVAQSCGGYHKCPGDNSLTVLSFSGFPTLLQLSIRVPAGNRCHTHTE